VGQPPFGGNDEKTAVFVQNRSRPRVPVRLTAPVHGKRDDTDSLNHTGPKGLRGRSARVTGKGAKRRGISGDFRYLRVRKGAKNTNKCGGGGEKRGKRRVERRFLGKRGDWRLSIVSGDSLR
jgi:hypothetical protein